MYQWFWEQEKVGVKNTIYEPVEEADEAKPIKQMSNVLIPD